MRIFISYRRQDSAGWSGRLFDSLSSRYGTEQVFLDIANIAAGTEFLSHAESAVLRSDAVLVVIGPGWLTATYREDSRRRIDDPTDLVRTELRTAIRLQKFMVPVLVGDAVMPDAAMLPPEIAPLAELNCVSLGDATWNQDIAQLTKLLDEKQRASRWTRWLPWKTR